MHIPHLNRSLHLCKETAANAEDGPPAWLWWKIQAKNRLQLPLGPRFQRIALGLSRVLEQVRH